MGGGWPRRRAQPCWPLQPRGPAAPETPAKEGEARPELPSAAATRCRAPAANQVDGFHSCPRNAPLQLRHIVGLVMNRTSAGFLHPTALGGINHCLCPELSPAWVRGEQPSPPESSVLLLCVPRHWDLLVGSHRWLKAQLFIPFLFFALFWARAWLPLVSSLGEQQGRGCGDRGLALPSLNTCPQFLELWMSQRLWGGRGSRSVLEAVPVRWRGVCPIPAWDKPTLFGSDINNEHQEGCCLLCSWFCSAGARPSPLGYTLALLMTPLSFSFWPPGRHDRLPAGLHQPA